MLFQEKKKSVDITFLLPWKHRLCPDWGRVQQGGRPLQPEGRGPVAPSEIDNWHKKLSSLTPSNPNLDSYYSVVLYAHSCCIFNGFIFGLLIITIRGFQNILSFKMVWEQQLIIIISEYLSTCHRSTNLSLFKRPSQQCTLWPLFKVAKSLQWIFRVVTGSCDCLVELYPECSSYDQISWAALHILSKWLSGRKWTLTFSYSLPHTDSSVFVFYFLLYFLWTTT